MASIFKTASGKWRVQVRRKGQETCSEYFSSHPEAVRWARGLRTKARIMSNWVKAFSIASRMS